MSESGKNDEGLWSNDKEKMIRDLKEAKIYEDAMTESEMQELLKVVRQSKEEANPGTANKNVNVTAEANRHDNQASYSRGPGGAKSTNRDSSSPELSSNQMRRNPTQGKRPSSGDESIFSLHGRNSFGRDNRDAPQGNANRARVSMIENACEATDNRRANLQLRNSQETPKHRINPLDAVANASDVALQPRRRSLPDKERVADDGNNCCVSIDTALPELIGHLHRIAEAWHSQHGSSHRARISWGAAIQAGKEDAGADEESVADATTEDAGPSETTDVAREGDRGRRSCTRRVVNYAAGEADESSEDEFESRAKKSTRNKDSSDRNYQPKETNVGNATTTRRRKIFPKRDDIYEWDEMNEEENASDEETRPSAKKMKVAKPSASPEYAATSGETASGESTKRSANDADEERISECEAVDEDDSDEQSRKGAKKKKPAMRTTATAKKTAARTKRQKSVEPSLENLSEEPNEPPVCIDDSDEIMISDNEASNATQRKSSRVQSEEAISSTSSTYPRRIVPPKPKGKFSAISARKPLHNFFNNSRGKKPSQQNEEECAEVNRQGRSNSGLQDSEITAALDSADEAEEVVAPVDVEIRPLRVTDRMKLQLERLKSIQKADEQKEFERARERKTREELEQLEKEERIRERVKEQKLRAKREEQEARAKAISEERWNSMLNQRGKKRPGERTELNPEGPRQSNDLAIIEVAQGDGETNDVEEVSADGQSGERPPQQVPCPICGKRYSKRLIEDHAAGCEEFEAPSSAGASRSNSPAFTTRSGAGGQRPGLTKLWECNVCSVFSTRDGKKYEDHVTTCIARHRDGAGNATPDGNNCRRPENTIVVPDSPIRNLRRVSELTDSEIDYRGQFVPKTKSKTNDNRKRKRL